MKSTSPYTVFEVTNTDGQRALRAKERILDTVSAEKDDKKANEKRMYAQSKFRIALIG